MVIQKEQERSALQAEERQAEDVSHPLPQYPEYSDQSQSLRMPQQHQHSSPPQNSPYEELPPQQSQPPQYHTSVAYTNKDSAENYEPYDLSLRQPIQNEPSAQNVNNNSYQHQQNIENRSTLRDATTPSNVPQVSQQNCQNYSPNVYSTAVGAANSSASMNPERTVTSGDYNKIYDPPQHLPHPPQQQPSQIRVTQDYQRLLKRSPTPSSSAPSLVPEVSQQNCQNYRYDYDTTRSSFERLLNVQQNTVSANSPTPINLVRTDSSDDYSQIFSYQPNWPHGPKHQQQQQPSQVRAMGGADYYDWVLSNFDNSASTPPPPPPLPPPPISSMPMPPANLPFIDTTQFREASINSDKSNVQNSKKSSTINFLKSSKPKDAASENRPVDIRTGTAKERKEFCSFVGGEKQQDQRPVADELVEKLKQKVDKMKLLKRSKTVVGEQRVPKILVNGEIEHIREPRTRNESGQNDILCNFVSNTFNNAHSRSSTKNLVRNVAGNSEEDCGRRISNGQVKLAMTGEKSDEIAQVYKILKKPEAGTSDKVTIDLEQLSIKKRDKINEDW